MDGTGGWQAHGFFPGSYYGRCLGYDRTNPWFQYHVAACHQYGDNES
jgi:hypothetical protein